MAGQIICRIDRLSVSPDLEMQCRLLSGKRTDFRNFLPRFDLLPLLDEQPPVIPVSGEPFIAVLDDDQLTVTDQSAADVNNLSRCGGQDGVTEGSGDVDSFIAGLRKSFGNYSV